MAESKNLKVKKVLPAVVLATSFYYSSLLCVGLILGYFGTKLYCKAFNIDENSDRRIFIDCGKFQIHVHHWILGAGILLLVWIVDYFYLPTFFTGAMFGMMAHDIYDFNDWHKVIVKK
jgi:hypothetical protein